MTTERQCYLTTWVAWGLLVGLTIGLARSGRAQPEPPVRRFGPEDFGGGRQVWDVAQAPSGTVALANAAGLRLFDGVRWRTYETPPGQTLRSVTYDRVRDAWLAGGYDAWFRWPRRALHLPPPPADTLAPPPGPREEWWHLLPDPGGRDRIYGQTFSRIACYAGTDTLAAVSVPGNVMYVEPTRRGLILPVLDRGLYARRGEGWAFLEGTGALATETVVGVADGARDGEVLVATRNAGVFALDGASLSPWPNVGGEDWWQAPLSDFLELPGGGYAVASPTLGVVFLDAGGRLVSRLPTDGKLGGVPIRLTPARDGGLWAGLDNGLAYVDLAGGTLLAAEGLGAVYDLERLGGALYVATNQGLFRTSSGPGARHAYAQLAAGQIWHVTPAGPGAVVGTNEGTFALDTAAGELSRIGTAAGGWTWLPLTDTTALAGTYVGVEAFALRTGRWRSIGRLPGYTGPVRALRRVGGDTLLVRHPQEGWLTFVGLDERGRPGATLRGVGVSRPTTTEEAWRWPLPGGGQVGVAGGRYFRSDVGVDTLFYELSAHVDYPSAALLPDGRLALGLTNGYAVVGTRARAEAAAPPVTASVEVRGRGAAVALAQARFGRAPRFRVRLADVDTAFTPWSERADFEYPLLPHGRYRLDYQSDDGQAGAVTWAVAPRWFETWWARLAYGLLAVGGFFALRRYYHRRLAYEARAAEVRRERQLQAERLRTRAAALETEVERTRRAATESAARAEVAAAEAEAAAAEAAAEVERTRRVAEAREREVEHRNRELARTTIALARQNDTLLQLREATEPLPKSGAAGKARRQLRHLIDEQLGGEEDWAFFREHFDVVHAGFLHRLGEAYPDLTAGDLRLAALLRMNLSSKEIAPLLHISLRGIENKRYRLRKKLGLGAEVNLAEWVLRY